MPSIRNLLCAVLTIGVLLSATSAEARFGKRSDSSESSKDDHEHDASAVGDDDDDDDDDHKSERRHSDAPRFRSSSGSFLVDLLFSILLDSRPSRSYSSPSGEVTSSSSEASPLLLRVGVDGGAFGQGAGLGAYLAIEGDRIGVDGRALALILPTDDGTSGTDNITLTNLHLTAAVISHPKARFRLEGGISSAHAPDLIVAGPSMALSFEGCIVGPLDVELRLQGTPYPYRQLDAHAGLALHFNTLVVRGGWRGLYLDDNGLVDGVVNRDAFTGPYLGLGFAF
ncbi:hypothetical protein [Hyalangium rubrum]|uniref:Outer membrane protein beta-barrel domain-containing protein n=1 Tax=Hyalangium rubrum TaxID=3103134 RepID=A0ABU5HB01_9BACT|nr:hypothetical protein [Hyalangium sp. s54d21]MDY7230054.1 hypothetical protein [Hyalangium sp. s54d21]